MSIKFIQTAEDIVILKKKKKDLDNEASDYEFGFDDLPRNLFANKKQKLILVPVTKNHKVNSLNRMTKHNKWNVNNNESQLKQHTALKENQHFEINETQNIIINEQAEEKSETVVAADKIVPGIDLNSVSPVFTDTHDSESETTHTVEFPLNPKEKDDCTIIQNAYVGEDEVLLMESSKESKTPILFQYNYFKVIEKSDNSYRAMCLICGLDENNAPKTVCSARNNVSSNLITHLKVTIEYFFIIISLLFLHHLFEIFQFTAKT